MQSKFLVNSPFASHKEVWSVSKLSTLMQCPRKYWYKYVLKVPDSKSIYLTRGIIFHELMSEFLNKQFSKKSEATDLVKSKIKAYKELGEPVSGNGFTEESLFNYILKAWEQNAKYIVEVPGFKLISFDDTINSGIGSEVPFKIPIVDIDTMQPLIKADLMGFIDLVYSDNKHPLYVKDFKLVSSKYDKFILNTDIQLALYAYAIYFLAKHNVLVDFDVKSIEKEKCIRTSLLSSVIYKKTEQVVLSPQDKKVSFDEIKATVQLVVQFIKNSKKQEFVPSYGEHCKFKCGYQEICLAQHCGEDFESLIAKEIDKANLAKLKIESDSLFEMVDMEGLLE